MIITSIYLPEKANALNLISLTELAETCKHVNMKIDINNGCITGAVVYNRDYVSIYDSRNNYIRREK